MASMDVVSMTFDTKDSGEPVPPAPINGQSAIFRRFQRTDKTLVSDHSGQPSDPPLLTAHSLQLDSNPDSKSDILHWVTAALLRSLSASFVHGFMHAMSLTDIRSIYR